jgi:hypothetical protein
MNDAGPRQSLDATIASTPMSRELRGFPAEPLAGLSISTLHHAAKLAAQFQTPIRESSLPWGIGGKSGCDQSAGDARGRRRTRRSSEPVPAAWLGPHSTGLALSRGLSPFPGTGHSPSRWALKPNSTYHLHISICVANHSRSYLERSR